VITWHTPLSFIVSFSLLSWTFGGLRNGLGIFQGDFVLQLFTGGMMLGAFFMATDMVTSPTTKKGMIVFGTGIGFFTFIFRFFGSLPEAVSLAIILMNIFVPTIDRYLMPKRFGEVIKTPKKEAQA
jgi:electron transport complex protein RnfD